MNNQFMNPYFNGYQQPQQANPYMDRLNQLQQYQQAIQPQQPMPTMTIIDSIDAVKAYNIPMDGNIHYFPKADGTEIYGKRWLPTGNTEILIYRVCNSTPEEEKSVLGLSGETTEVFLRRFDELNEKIDQLGLTWTNSSTKNAKSSSKKESEA